MTNDDFFGFDVENIIKELITDLSKENLETLAGVLDYASYVVATGSHSIMSNYMCTAVLAVADGSGDIRQRQVARLFRWAITRALDVDKHANYRTLEEFYQGTTGYKFSTQTMTDLRVKILQYISGEISRYLKKISGKD